MLYITYSAAILGALFNAISSLIERIATNKPNKDKLFSLSFFHEMIRSRLFILGFLLQIAGFGATALALKNGPLIIVEPLLTIDLVFLLVLIHWRLKLWVKLRDWIAVGAIILGLSGLMFTSNPHGGRLNYQTLPWIVLVSIIGPIILALAIITKRVNSVKIRALLAGIAASFAYALAAAFTKLSLNLFNRYGFEAVLTNWSIYGLIVVGIISIYLMTNVYGAGPLAISQPTMEIFDPTITVMIGILIFGDSYNTSLISLILIPVCGLLLVFGIMFLGSSPTLHQAEIKGM